MAAVAGRHDLAAVRLLAHRPSCIGETAILPLRPRPVAFALALDQTLNSPLNAVPSVSGIPLPLGLGVDHRMSSFNRPSVSCSWRPIS